MRGNMQKNGFLFLPEWYPDKSTEEILAQIGKKVDIQILLPASGISNVQALIPKNIFDAGGARYSAEFGLNDFPFHTDLAHWARPPRYLVLRCVQGDASVSTKLLSACAIYKLFDVSYLRKALFRPRKKSYYGSLNILPLVFFESGVLAFRWDSLFLTPMNAAAREFRKFMLESEAGWSNRSEIILYRPGDTLVVDNWCMLHGRSSVGSQSKRRVERGYLSELESW